MFHITAAVVSSHRLYKCYLCYRTMTLNLKENLESIFGYVIQGSVVVKLCVTQVSEKSTESDKLYVQSDYIHNINIE